MSEQPLTTCINCKQERVRRVVSGGMGVIFKGSGFYVNDSKKSTSPSPKVKDATGKATDGKNKAPSENAPQNDKSTQSSDTSPKKQSSNSGTNG